MTALAACACSCSATFNKYPFEDFCLKISGIARKTIFGRGKTEKHILRDKTGIMLISGEEHRGTDGGFLFPSRTAYSVLVNAHPVHKEVQQYK